MQTVRGPVIFLNMSFAEVMCPKLLHLPTVSEIDLTISDKWYCTKMATRHPIASTKTPSWVFHWISRNIYMQFPCLIDFRSRHFMNFWSLMSSKAAILYPHLCLPIPADFYSHLKFILFHATVHYFLSFFLRLLNCPHAELIKLFIASEGDGIQLKP